MTAQGNEKPYNDLNRYLRKRFGRKVYKLALSGGMTCPNRDGTCGVGGCIFCSEGGSGDFAADGEAELRNLLREYKTLIAENELKQKNEYKIQYESQQMQTGCAGQRKVQYGTEQKAGNVSGYSTGAADIFRKIGENVRLQISSAREKVKNKLGNEYENAGFIAYFQSFTNTYAPLGYLKALITPALEAKEICAVSIGTRPDCLTDETIEWLALANKEKPIMIELGLQTSNDETAVYINRGYKLETFEAALSKLKRAGLEVIVHVILGLPYETRADMLETVRYLAGKNIDGIKLQLLHVMRGTELGKRFLTESDYEENLHISSPEEYISVLAECLSIIPERIVIHRLTGDAPHEKLLFPMWSANKRITLNGLLKYMRDNGIVQGCKR